VKRLTSEDYKEAEYLRALSRNRYFLRVFDVQNNNEYKFVIMEYFTRDLQQLIFNDANMMSYENQYVSILRQIILGMKFCHSKNITHCDIKPLNIMVTESLQVMIVDFGMAKEIGDSVPENSGTPGYIPPELLLDSVQASPCLDVWCIGYVFVVISLESGFKKMH